MDGHPRVWPLRIAPADISLDIRPAMCLALEVPQSSAFIYSASQWQCGRLRRAVLLAMTGLCN
jgi:hypothetical protein